MLVCGTNHPTLFIELQPHEELLLPIVQVPCQLFIRDELGTLHLLFLLESLILVGRSWECHPLEQVFRAHTGSCNPLALLLLECRQGMKCGTVMECATSTLMRDLLDMTSHLRNCRYVRHSEFGVLEEVCFELLGRVEGLQCVV